MTQCICGAPATRRVITTTVPNDDTRLMAFGICEQCYVREGWAEHDLTGQVLR